MTTWQKPITHFERFNQGWRQFDVAVACWSQCLNQRSY